MDPLTSGVRMRLLHDGALDDIGWEQAASLDWSSFGVVLGAGGLTGGAFETGVLLALEWDHGIRLQDADAWVGTSAGSIGATLLSLGFGATDIAAMMMGAPHHVASRPDELRFPFDAQVPPVNVYGSLRLPTPGVMLRSAHHLVRRRARMLLLEWLRRGRLDPRQFVVAFEGLEWADHPRLRICVTDAATGERVVLGPTDEIRLLDAVAASCSVPGVMQPVEAGGRRFVDGGVWSPTNADVLAGADGPATVLVVSPMSGSRASTPIGRVSSRFAGWRLSQELRAFRPAQTVLVVEPTEALSAAVVDDALTGAAVADILLGAFTAPALVH